MASSAATAGQQPDQYGQLHPVETPELIAEKRKEFEEEVKKLSPDHVANLKQAEDKCPELLTDEFKLMFLRCEVFNADLAAKRYAHYWDKRVDVFGPEKAFQPLTLSEALKDDKVALNIGFFELVPNVSDPIGRAIIFVDPSRQDRTKYERKSMARAMWYTIHSALESQESQKHGVLLLLHGKDAKFSQFDRELGKINMSSLQGAIPLRISAFHVCSPPSFFRIIFAIMSLFMKPHVKKRMLVHSNNKEQTLKKLESYGLRKDVLPTQIGGVVELDLKAWLDHRESEDK